MEERFFSLYTVIPPRQGCALPLRQQSRLRQSQTLRIVTKFRIRNVLDSVYDVKKEEGKKSILKAKQSFYGYMLTRSWSIVWKYKILFKATVEEEVHDSIVVKETSW